MGNHLPFSRIAAILFTDIVGSVQLKESMGAVAYATALAQHDEAFRNLCAKIDGSMVKDTGDGFVATFPTVSAAVTTALRFHGEVKRAAEYLHLRIGLNVGEVILLGDEANGQPKLVGRAMDLAARLMGMARADQILLSQAVFDEARQFVRAHPCHAAGRGDEWELEWLAHGSYLCKGIDEPIEVFEVGVAGQSPCQPPPDGEKARRAVAADEEAMLGWRPAAGLQVHGRDGWVLTRELGSGSHAEVWLGQHVRLRDQRVFKFCFGRERVRSLKREMTLFRLMKDALGDRPDITRLHDVRLDQPPYFLETDYTDGGNLADWAEKNGDIELVPIAVRLDLVARTAEAVAAAHSVGVLHKDIKPTNILIYRGEDGQPRPRLSDFGIGELSDHAAINKHSITVTGFTQGDDPTSSRSGTRMYAPPELLAGRPFTIEGDVYALGVLLYQMVVGDLSRPLGHGWEADVADELLREDIAACVAGDPSRRLSSAAELARRLRSLEERRGKRRQRDEDLRRERDALGRAKKRYDRSVRALLVIATVGVVLFVILLLQVLRRVAN